MKTITKEVNATLEAKKRQAARREKNNLVLKKELEQSKEIVQDKEISWKIAKHKANFAIETENITMYYEAMQHYIVNKAIKLLQKDNYKVDYKDMEDVKQEGYTALWDVLTNWEESKVKEKIKVNEKYEETGNIIIYEAWYEMTDQLLFLHLMYKVKGFLVKYIRANSGINYNITLDSLAERGYIDKHLNALEQRVNARGNIELLSCLLNKTEYNFLVEYLQDRAIAKNNNTAWANIKQELKALAYRLIDYKDLELLLTTMAHAKKEKLEEFQLCIDNKNKAQTIIYQYLKNNTEVSSKEYSQLMDYCLSKGFAKMLRKLS